MCALAFASCVCVLCVLMCNKHYICIYLHVYFLVAFRTARACLSLCPPPLRFPPSLLSPPISNQTTVWGCRGRDGTIADAARSCRKTRFSRRLRMVGWMIVSCRRCETDVRHGAADSGSFCALCVFLPLIPTSHNAVSLERWTPIWSRQDLFDVDNLGAGLALPCL